MLPLPRRSPGTLDHETIRADLGSLAHAGFRHVDLVDTWLSPADLSRSERGILLDVLAELQLGLVGISVIRRSVIDPVDGPANVAHTRKSIDAAAELGAPVLSIGFHRPLTELQRQWAFWTVPGPRDDPAAYDAAVPLVADLAAYAADRGVRLSLELYEDTLLGTGAGAARLVEDVGAPNLGVNADLANLYRLPARLAETWLETFRRVLPHMNYWHVKNYRRVEVYPDGPYLAWPTDLDSGDIDYRLALGMAADAGYTGPICVEHYGGDALWSQRRGLRYLTSLLETQ
ncbi:xylose isomerase [Microbispora siamensis]|uniref:Xylose isomerase n=2 Tax=Microbispora siamensis TaxID=564413 RepID=A0ABQ4GRS4_9ACTN|nr:xylose isomerase [Microbispora siamensis]